MVEYNCDMKESIDPTDEIQQLAHERWLAYTNGEQEIDPDEEISELAHERWVAKHSEHYSIDEITAQLGIDPITIHD